MVEQTASIHVNLKPDGQIQDQFQSDVCIENVMRENSEHFACIATENQQRTAESFPPETSS